MKKDINHEVVDGEPAKIAPLWRPKPTHEKPSPRCAMKDSDPANCTSCAAAAREGKYERGVKFEGKEQEILIGSQRADI